MTTWKRTLRTVRRVWVFTGAVVFVVFTLWSLIAFQEWGVDDSLMKSGRRVQVVDTASAIRFVPAAAAERGLLFFPGGLVDPEAYVPIARRVAEEGHEAVIVRVPFRGMFNIASRQDVAKQGAELIDAGNASEWVIAGHSKGGVYASTFASRFPDRTAALVLAGTSHPREISLVSLQAPVTRLVAERDLLASPERAAATRHNLPPHAEQIVIAGANHSQFGYYGFQPGDLVATISRERQQAILMDALLEALRASGNQDR